MYRQDTGWIRFTLSLQTSSQSPLTMPSVWNALDNLLISAALASDIRMRSASSGLCFKNFCASNKCAAVGYSFLLYVILCRDVGLRGELSGIVIGRPEGTWGPATGNAEKAGMVFRELEVKERYGYPEPE